MIAGDYKTITYFKIAQHLRKFLVAHFGIRNKVVLLRRCLKPWPSVLFILLLVINRPCQIECSVFFFFWFLWFLWLLFLFFIPEKLAF